MGWRPLVPPRNPALKGKIVSDSRSRFEQAMNRAGILSGMFSVNEDGDYVNEMMQGSWLVWQAAEAQTVRDCVEACESRYAKIDAANKYIRRGAEIWIEAIRAAFPHAFKE